MLYVVKETTVKHNGQTYPPGSEIELNGKEAEPLKKYLDPGKKGKK